MMWAAWAWALSGAIPAMIFEIWLCKRYGAHPEYPSYIRVALGCLFGPIVLIAIAIIMYATEEDEDA